MSQATTPSGSPSAAGDYRVELSAYAGPLDLLLYLVKRHEIDLHDIPIATLTGQYLDHLQAMQKHSPLLDVEQAGDFLVMAATLVEIKSRIIAPTTPDDESSDPSQDAGVSEKDSADPRLELVHQLLAYKRIKDAAGELDRRYQDWQSRFPAQAAAAPQSDDDDQAAVRELDLEDADITDLHEAFDRLLESVGKGPMTHDVEYDDTPISLHADDIHDRLQREGKMSLREMFAGRGKRSELIGLFLATLELVRQRRVRVAQRSPGEDIQLELNPEADDDPDDTPSSAQGDPNPPTASSPDPSDLDAFDWPDETARKRAERRHRRRQAAEQEDGQPPSADLSASADDDLDDEDDLLDD